MSGPLSGVKIIDLSSVVTGPYATQILADMGAEVIKVEEPNGDIVRYVAPSTHSGMSSTFMQVNRNKKSVVLNLKEGEDHNILNKLLEDADVFIANMRPNALSRLGLSYDDLKRDYPRLIYCTIYGFSKDGPYAGYPAYDDLIQAMSGIADMQGRNKEEYKPEFFNTVIADKVTGLTAVYAISMALYEREKSGLGQAIDIPMFETMVAFNFAEHMGEATFVSYKKPKMGYSRVLAPSRKPYQTRDGYIGLLPYTNEQWKRFFTLAGYPKYTTMVKFMDPFERGKNIAELYSILESIIVDRTADEWVELLKDADIPITYVYTMEDLLTNEHLNAIDFFQYREHPVEGMIRMPDISVKYSRTPGEIRTVAPMLGEDTDAIKKSLEK